MMLMHFPPEWAFRGFYGICFSVLFINLFTVMRILISHKLSHQIQKEGGGGEKEGEGRGDVLRTQQNQLSKATTVKLIIELRV